jgi:hypothetical protein
MLREIRPLWDVGNIVPQPELARIQKNAGTIGTFSVFWRSGLDRAHARSGEAAALAAGVM